MSRKVTSTDRLLRRLRARARFWRREQRVELGKATKAGDEAATRHADTAWGVEESIAHVHRWIELERSRTTRSRK